MKRPGIGVPATFPSRPVCRGQLAPRHPHPLSLLPRRPHVREARSALSSLTHAAPQGPPAFQTRARTLEGGLFVCSLRDPTRKRGGRRRGHRPEELAVSEVKSQDSLGSRGHRQLRRGESRRRRWRLS